MTDESEIQPSWEVFFACPVCYVSQGMPCKSLKSKTYKALVNPHKPRRMMKTPRRRGY